MNRLQHPVPWWQSGVIYHLYVRSFKDSNGDGNGDLAGVLHQLDYLNETLQVDALWLSSLTATASPRCVISPVCCGWQGCQRIWPLLHQKLGRANITPSLIK